MLRINNLSFSYDGKINVIDKLSLDVLKGDFIAITGPNGAGKTTLMKILTRINNPYSGSILLEKNELSGISAKERAKIIAEVSQNINITYPITALELVLTGRVPHMSGLFESAKDIEIALECMKLTSSVEFANISVSKLSGGQRQRVMIARALSQEPRLLLLDEPTSSLDARYQEEVMVVLQQLNKDKGLTIMMVTHDRVLIEKYCSREFILPSLSLF